MNCLRPTIVSLKEPANGEEICSATRAITMRSATMMTEIAVYNRPNALIVRTVRATSTENLTAQVHRYTI